MPHRWFDSGLCTAAALTAPQVAIGTTTDATATKPYLANSSMESYERAACTGCHTKGSFKNTANATINTDMMYWLMLEVPAAGN